MLLYIIFKKAHACSGNEALKFSAIRRVVLGPKGRHRPWEISS